MALCVLIVAVVGGVIWLRSGENTQAIDGEGDPGVTHRSKAPRQARPVAIRTRPELSSDEATRRLRDLLTQEPSFSHLFETVERWAGDLDDSAIRELIVELGMEEYRGLTGWVRCALYAEWARRDPRGALAWAEALPDSGDHHNYAVQQVLFSVLRGWAESDPEAAFGERNRLGRRLGAGSSPIGDLIFTELVRRDPEARWEMCKSSPPRAFFMGLDGKESVTHYLDRWDEEQWRSTEAHQEFASYKVRMENHQDTSDPLDFLDFVQEPVGERVAVGAALTLAEHDVEGAVSWLATHGPGDDTDRRGRVSMMLHEWATAHPAEALKFVEQDRLRNHTVSLVCGAILGDPGVAVRFMELIDNHSERSTMLDSAFHQGGVHEHDFFPAPGLPNRLPNFRERYECLLEAVEAGNFQSGQKRSLLSTLHEEFRHQVPEAQQAYDAMGEGGK